MGAEILTVLLRVNIAAALAILAVLLLRKPLRAIAGSRIAYGLWLIVPLAAAASLAPARVAPPLPAPVARVIEPMIWMAPPRTSLVVTPEVALAAVDPVILILATWLAGAALCLVLVAVLQRRSLSGLGRMLAIPGARRLYKTSAQGFGPAVVGGLFPRIVLPADFDVRFDAKQRSVVIAHEEAHLAAFDTQINAVCVFLQCLFWFNPLVHIAAFHVRLDQELACDAAVMARYPEARRSYAEAMLKTQLAQAPLPLGCYWPARSAHPLKERLAMLKLAPPPRVRRLAGAAAIALVAAGVGYAAWAAQPPRPAPIPRPAVSVLTIAAVAPTLADDAVIAPASTVTLAPPALTVPFTVTEAMRFAAAQGLDRAAASYYATIARQAANKANPIPPVSVVDDFRAAYAEALSAGLNEDTARFYGSTTHLANQQGRPRPPLAGMTAYQNMIQRFSDIYDASGWPGYGPMNSRMDDVQLRGRMLTADGQSISLPSNTFAGAGVTIGVDTDHPYQLSVAPQGDHDIGVIIALGLADGSVLDTGGVLALAPHEKKVVALRGGHTLEIEAWIPDDVRVRRMFNDPASYPAEMTRPLAAKTN